MKNLKFNSAICALLSATTCLLITQSAKAEGEKPFGDGAHGVNRVIQTPLGYRSVSGKYKLSFSSPRNQDGQFKTTADRTSAERGTTIESHLDPALAIENRPSVYIGGNFRAVRDADDKEDRSEIDAGIQAEVVTKYLTPPGWSIFFYAAAARYIPPGGTSTVFPPDPPGKTGHRLELNPRVYDALNPVPEGTAWRDTTFGEISGSMALNSTDDGRAQFYCDSLPGNHIIWATEERPTGAGAVIPNYWRVSKASPLAPRNENDAAGNPSAVVLLDKDYYSRAFVKRVTAMTRPSPFKSQIDGSQLTSTWSECKVQQFGAGQGLNDWLPTAAKPSVDQGESGYDAPGGIDNNAWDKRYLGQRTSLSKTIVQFSEDEKINAQMRAGVYSNSRYITETVKINLGTLTRPLGEPLQ